MTIAAPIYVDFRQSFGAKVKFFSPELSIWSDLLYHVIPSLHEATKLNLLYYELVWSYSAKNVL